MQFFSKPDPYIAVCGDLRCGTDARQIPDAPPFMDGLRAVFLSDIHALPRTTAGQMDALAGRIMALRPDIVLLGGDYADAPEDALRLFDRLRAVTAPLGCYGVAGNNDRECFPDLQRLRRAMSDAGFALLVNEAHAIRRRGGRLIVAGLDEYHHGAPDPAGLYPAEAAPDRYRLLVSHYPCAIRLLPDLMLCGHTHGGQFNALGLTPYTIGFERLTRPSHPIQFIAGEHRMGGARVLVSKGIGASRIPLRVGVRPEIHLITFGSSAPQC